MSSGWQTRSGLTVDQERFARLLLAGRSQSDAYREVWPRSRQWKPESVHVAASKMAAKVAPRCGELLEASTENARLTIAQTVNDLREARELAIESGDAGGAVRMTAALARLCGMMGKQGAVTRDSSAGTLDAVALLRAVEEKVLQRWSNEICLNLGDA
jgi:hypothetical protein